jgi:hypothetical protein
MIKTRLAIWITSSALLSGCGFMAVQTAPAKKAATTRSEAAMRSDALFWQTLHSGDYEGIGRALQANKAAYLHAPDDAITASRVGFLHIWRLAENARLDTLPPDITDDAVMARKYFEEAYSLDPSDARIQGFLASSLLAEGSIHKDQALTRKGYYMMRDAIDAWPEFNLFTAGYVMSPQPRDSERFREALEWQWRNIEECVGVRVDRRQPSMAPFMNKAASTEVKNRACWNSAIAPHNFEGFFLNMGDMLVKSGDWQSAQQIYANAKLSPSYGEWKFSAVLERRIEQAQANVDTFNAVLPSPRSQAPGDNVIMNRSRFACVACHQR